MSNGLLLRVSEGSLRKSVLGVRPSLEYENHTEATGHRDEHRKTALACGNAVGLNFIARNDRIRTAGRPAPAGAVTRLLVAPSLIRAKSSEREDVCTMAIRSPDGSTTDVPATLCSVCRTVTLDWPANARLRAKAASNASIVEM